MLEKVQGKGNTHPLLIGVQNGTAPVEISVELPQKDPTSYCRDTYSSMFIAAQFVIDRHWELPRCPSADEQIMTMWNIYTVEYYSVVKKMKLWIFRQVE